MISVVAVFIGFGKFDGFIDAFEVNGVRLIVYFEYRGIFEKISMFDFGINNDETRPFFEILKHFLAFFVGNEINALE